MNLSPLTAISPVDGRYRNKTEELSYYFSEFGLIKYRVVVEIEYFMAMCELGIPQLENFDHGNFTALRNIFQNFSLEDAQRIKDIEAETNHDVKAVEYFLKEKFDALGFGDHKEFIHFALTSQDINNTATPLSIKHFIDNSWKITFNKLISELEKVEKSWSDISMLARTHGQPASPTKLGKEIRVFKERLLVQSKQLENIPWSAKFGGATGNLNAHKVAYPDIDWQEFANDFTKNKLGLERSYPTTQIEHYDNLAALFDLMSRVNTILLDLSKDFWTYISMDYLKQKIVPGEVGSSTMPHKVNPIDFENAEGNLGISNALFSHLARKLPVSRLQRDLTDSTVLRNIGIPFAHMLIAFKSLLKGLDKVSVNEEKIAADLEGHWMVVAEAIQTILRREGFPQPYEQLKELTRSNGNVNKEVMHKFVDGLDIPDELKDELKAVTPANYTGITQ